MDLAAASPVLYRQLKHVLGEQWQLLLWYAISTLL